MTKIKSILASVAVLLCGGAWAAKVVSWDGNLAEGVKDGYSMSIRATDASYARFEDGIAKLSKHSSGAASHGVVIAKQDGSSLVSGSGMTVFVRFSGLNNPGGNTALLSALWGATDKEFVNNKSGSGYKGVGLAYNVTSTTVTNWAIDQESAYNPGIPANDAVMMVSFCGDASDDNRKGVTCAYGSKRPDGSIAFYEAYHSTTMAENGAFNGIKIGGTIAGISGFHRPDMNVSGVAIYDQAMTTEEASNLEEFKPTSVDHIFPYALTADYAPTGLCAESVDDLLNYNIYAELVGSYVDARPLGAIGGLFPVKQSDGSLKMEFQASDNQTKGVSAIFKVEDGVVYVKGYKACYFSDGSRIGESMFNDNGTARNPGSTTIESSLAIGFAEAGYGMQNLRLRA